MKFSSDITILFYILICIPMYTHLYNICFYCNMLYEDVFKLQTPLFQNKYLYNFNKIATRRTLSSILFYPCVYSFRRYGGDTGLSKCLLGEDFKFTFNPLLQQLILINFVIKFRFTHFTICFDK